MSASTLTLGDLQARVAAFVNDRDWSQFHNPKNLSMAIAIEAAELMECFQWQSLEEIDAEIHQQGAPRAAIDELADVLLYCLSLANALQVNDLGEVVLAKLRRNETRYPAEQFRGRYR